MNYRALVSGPILGILCLGLAEAQTTSLSAKRISETGQAIEVETIPGANFAARGPSLSAAAGNVLPVAIRPFQGQNGAGITKHLQDALAESRSFRLMNGGAGLPIVTGAVAPGFVEGKLLEPSGKPIFTRRYESGNPRMDARRFADDVTLRLTKRRGIASSQIAFVAPRSGQKPEICLCDADGKNLRQLTKDGRGNRAPSISADGSRILYTATGNGQATLLLYNLVDGSLSPMTQSPAAYAVGALSPDGRQVAMTAGPTAQNSDLFIIDTKSGKSDRITATPNAERSPTWSPDGESIIFSASDATGQTSLFQIGTGRKAIAKPVITGLVNADNPDWSPDGQRVAFNALDPSTRQAAVFVLELSSGQVRKLAAGTEPAWGADSRHLVYVGTGGLHLADAFSGQSRHIVGNMGQITNPTWTR